MGRTIKQAQPHGGERETKMQTFGQTDATQVATTGSAPVPDADGIVPFTMEDLSKMPTKELVALHNGQPGVNRVSKFENRAIAISRTFAALGNEPELGNPQGITINGGTTVTNAHKPPAKGVKKAKKKAVKKTPAKAKAKRKATAGVRDGSKSAKIITLLQRPKGATLDEIMEKMTWLAHSVRGFISTLIKNGTKVESFKPEGGKRTYRIA